MATSFSIRTDKGTLRVEFFGPLRQATAEQLEKELSLLGKDAASRSLDVLFNTIAMSELDENAKIVLVRIQKGLASWARRSAWLDNRAAFRGMALWVMHLAEDKRSKALSTEQQCLGWFNSSGEREQGAIARVGTLDRGRDK